MMNKPDFTKIAKRILRSKSGIQNPKIMHPEREWGTGLLVGAVVLIIIAGWSAETYLSNRNLSTNSSIPVEGEIVVYRESMVKAALEVYQVREEVHKKLLDETYTPPMVIEEVTETETSTSTEGVTDDVLLEDMTGLEETEELTDEIESETSGVTEVVEE